MGRRGKILPGTRFLFKKRLPSIGDGTHRQARVKFGQEKMHAKSPSLAPWADFGVCAAGLEVTAGIKLIDAIEQPAEGGDTNKLRRKLAELRQWLMENY